MQQFPKKGKQWVRIVETGEMAVIIKRFKDTALVQRRGVRFELNYNDLIEIKNG